MRNIGCMIFNMKNNKDKIFLTIIGKDIKNYSSTPEMTHQFLILRNK